MNLAPVPPPTFPPGRPPFPPYFDWVARTQGTGTVTSVMAARAFTNATSDFTSYLFQIPNGPNPPNPPVTRNTLIAGDILKDLGTVVHTYDQLGSPNPIHVSTYRLVQLVAGGDANGWAAHEVDPYAVHSECAYGNAANQYNTFWIRTWSAAPYWARPAAIARLG